MGWFYKSLFKALKVCSLLCHSLLEEQPDVRRRHLLLGLHWALWGPQSKQPLHFYQELLELFTLLSADRRYEEAWFLFIFRRDAGTRPRSQRYRTPVQWPECYCYCSRLPSTDPTEDLRILVGGKMRDTQRDPTRHVTLSKQPAWGSAQCSLFMWCSKFPRWWIELILKILLSKFQEIIVWNISKVFLFWHFLRCSCTSKETK